MKVRDHIVLVAGGGLCTLLLLIALGFLLRAGLAYREQSKSIDQQYRRLAELNARNPFPSSENVEGMVVKHDQLELHIDALNALLGRDPFPLDDVEAVGFSARAQGVIERFRKRADQAGIVLPENLEAGFSQYASGGAIPATGHVPRLSRQLFSIERVADVLVSSGVTSIDTLTREAFEAPVAAPRRRSRRAAPTSTPKDDSRTKASVVQPDGLYYIERIGASFTATETSVWRVLDQLASTEHFMVVTDFSHITQSDILAFDSGRQSGEVDDDIREFLSSGILSGSKALARRERIVAGNETIQVSLLVDVYNFMPVAEDPVQ